MYFVHVYIKKKIQKKNQDFQIFPKKREKLKKKKKCLWTRGIEPLSHLKKKKKNLWTRGIGLPSDFFKKGPFFFFQRFQDSLKASFQNGT